MADLYAKVVEDNGGGLHLYVMSESEECIYAHSGYEYGKVGRLKYDLEAIRLGDSTDDWDGKDEILAEEWKKLDLDQVGIELIAEVADEQITTYPQRMGAAGKREFGVSRD